MYSKKSIGRELVEHPTRITSSLIRNELTCLQILGPEMSDEACAKSLPGDHELGDQYHEHPITVQAFKDGFRAEHIVPLSIYCDGVQYSVNENFIGFYVCNLRTKRSQLLWLLRVSSGNKSFQVLCQGLIISVPNAPGT